MHCGVILSDIYHKTSLCICYQRIINLEIHAWESLVVLLWMKQRNMSVLAALSSYVDANSCLGRCCHRPLAQILIFTTPWISKHSSVEFPTFSGFNYNMSHWYFHLSEQQIWASSIHKMFSRKLCALMSRFAYPCVLLFLFIFRLYLSQITTKLQLISACL